MLHSYTNLHDGVKSDCFVNVLIDSMNGAHQNCHRCSVANFRETRREVGDLRVTSLKGPPCLMILLLANANYLALRLPK